MKPSPIQLLQMFYRRIHVELDQAHMPAEPPNPLTSIFIFDGISITTGFGIEEVDGGHEHGRLFTASLRVRIDNQPLADQTNQKFCPYCIDIELDGVILVPGWAQTPGPAEDLAAVNGAAVLWSATREQVLALTSRMPAGPVTLPTVHFGDLRKSAPSVSSE